MIAALTSCIANASSRPFNNFLMKNFMHTLQIHDNASGRINRATPRLFAFVLTIFSIGFAGLANAEGGSPWLPIPGQVSLSIGQSEQSGKSAYIGKTNLPISAITGGAASKYKRSTTGLRLDYGFSDALSFDASLNYSAVKVGAADKDSGLGDTTLGLNYRVLDEFERPGLPTVTLRGAVIVKGNYDGARLASIGKDANGFEFAALVGKQFGESFSVWGELGIQNRNASVPNATFFEIGARVRLAPGLSANIGYTDKKYGGSLDIGGPGFSPARFQQVSEERSTFKLGASYAIAGNQTVALNFAKLVRGRNTVKDDSNLGISYTIGF